MAGRGPQPSEPCGTPAAARRHYRNGEPVCDACKRANRIDKSIRTGSDPWDSTRGGGRPDHRPVRNGIPVRLYVYQGSGADAITGEVVTL
jgi:hypothetical protein